MKMIAALLMLLVSLLATTTTVYAERGDIGGVGVCSLKPSTRY